MSLHKQLREILEVPLARLGLAAVPRLPRRAVVVLARFLGSAACALAGHLHRVGLANLDLAYGASLTSRQKRAILRQSFQTAALVMLDVLWFTRDRDDRLRRWVVKTADAEQRLREKKATIFVTAHLGNWEVMGQAADVLGFPLASVAAPLRNERVDRLLKQARGVSGQRIVPREGAAKALLSTLRNGGSVGILLDQNTKPSEGGLFVDFFGLPVPVSSAGATLALHTRSRILFAFAFPEADGRYRLDLPAGLDPERRPGEGRREAAARLTQEITRVTEEQIRRNPGAWLWMYKRWKYVAPGRRRDEYPFYAKELRQDDLRALG